jgi:hypothetical protein
LQAAIDHKRILFAARSLDEHFDQQRKQKIPISELKWEAGISKTSDGAAMIDFIDKQKNNIELTKMQCGNIEVISNPQGSQSFQLPQNMKRQKGPNRARKDSYSALVLGNWFAKIYYDTIFLPEESKKTETFTPYFI